MGWGVIHGIDRYVESFGDRESRFETVSRPRRPGGQFMVLDFILALSCLKTIARYRRGGTKNFVMLRGFCEPFFSNRKLPP